MAQGRYEEWSHKGVQLIDFSLQRALLADKVQLIVGMKNVLNSYRTELNRVDILTFYNNPVSPTVSLQDRPRMVFVQLKAKHQLRVRDAAILLIIGAQSACLEPDLKLPAAKSHVLTVDIGPEQPYAFVDVTHQDLHIPPETDWDLKFQNEDEKWAIFLNPLKDISISKTDITNWEDVDAEFVVQNELDWFRDLPLEKDILPAIGTWGDYEFEFPQSYNRVYLLRFRDSVSLKYRKFQILGATKERYTLLSSELDGSYEAVTLIPKQSSRLHSYLKLDSLPILKEVEPEVDHWHLNFTFGDDSIAKNRHQLPIKYRTDSIAGYHYLGVNKSRTALAYVDEDFEEVDYFLAKDASYGLCEFIPDRLIYFDKSEGVYKT